MPNIPVPKRWAGESAPVRYPSRSTRFFSLDVFQGGAEINPTPQKLQTIPGEINENLEARFVSGVNRTDVPRMWGHPNVNRFIGPVQTNLANDIQGWRRNNGEPL